MKRIAFIAKNFGVNGISTLMINYSLFLDPNEYFIDIFVGNPISKENVEKLNGFSNIHIINTPSKRGKNPLKYYFFLKKHLKNYDIVHVNGNSRTIIIELLISKINHNRKNIAHSHSICCDKKIFHILAKPFFKYFYDYGLACSNEAGVWMFGNNSFEVINNGIDIKKYLYSEKCRKKIRSELNILDSTLLIGHVGNFAKSKNYPFLFETFKKIKKINNNTKLLLIGDYSNDLKFKENVEKSEFSNDVIFYGIPKHIRELYNAMDVFVFPSLYEGLGIVLFEAQCNGLKCFVSSAIPKEAFKINELIFTNEIDDSSTWCNIIVEEYNKDRNRCLSEQNLKNILSIDLSKSINQLEKIYNK